MECFLVLVCVVNIYYTVFQSMSVAINKPPRKAAVRKIREISNWICYFSLNMSVYVSRFFFLIFFLKKWASTYWVVGRAIFFFFFSICQLYFVDFISQPGFFPMGCWNDAYLPLTDAVRRFGQTIHFIPQLTAVCSLKFIFLKLWNKNDC